MGSNKEKLLGLVEESLSSYRNATALCVAIHNDETQHYDMTAHLAGDNYALDESMRLLVKGYLEGYTDDEMADLVGDILIDIINKDKQRRKEKLQNVDKEC